MTLADFTSRFLLACNRGICSFVAGVEAEGSHLVKLALTGVDTALGKLIKVLNAFSGSLSGSVRRLANTICSTITSTNAKNWNALICDMNIASGIYVLLHHLSITINSLKHVSTAILIESLQDSLNLKHGFEDEWEVVQLTERVNRALPTPQPQY